MSSFLEPFRRWAALPNLAVLDTETTGLRGEVIELAIVNGAGETLFNARMKPSCQVEPGAHAVHGITDADLAGLPTIADYWPELREILNAHRVVIYNRSFDLPRLRQSLDAAMPGWFDDREQRDAAAFDQLHYTSECVMLAYAPVWSPSLRWAKLADACRREGVETADLGAAHSALGDCLRTLRLIRAVARQGVSA